ncbi:MAG: type I phosphomannose isomerase catalytic subunit [Candidatus Nanopelagicales bacterium]
MPHIVEGALKDYDWGIVDGLARWHRPTGRPQAEVWFGTHPAGPTRVIAGPDEGLVLADIDAHHGMPLVKLLAAAGPLSLQVHPDEETARRGRNAGSDLYADAQEKSEMLVALEPFDIHAGWRDADAAAAMLDNAGAPADAVAAVRRGDRPEAIRILLRDSAPQTIDGAVRAARDVGWSGRDVAALARVAEAFPLDPGVLVAALLDHDVLEPGDAIAVGAGTIHSYVGGRGVEVMTTSDNVLRLGLTSKTVAVDEALAAVHDDGVPQRLRGGIGHVLEPAGMPFDLVIVDSPWLVSEGRHRVVLAMDGDVVVDDGAGAGEVVPQGRAIVWAPDESDALINPRGRAIVVTGRPSAARQLPG